jgi:hypothetical protein
MSADFEEVRRHVKAAESATRILRKAWGNLGGDLKDALQYHLDGTLGLTSPAPSADQILKNCEHNERIFAVLNDDLWPLVGELAALRDVLRANSARNPFEFSCALQISRA